MNPTAAPIPAKPNMIRETTTTMSLSFSRNKYENRQAATQKHPTAPNIRRIEN